RWLNSSCEAGMQALEHGLRTLPKTLALFVKLTQNFKTRFFFCLPALNGGELFFHAGNTLLMMSQHLLATLNSGSIAIGFIPEFLCRRLRSGGLVLDSRADGFYVGNRGI